MLAAPMTADGKPDPAKVEFLAFLNTVDEDFLAQELRERDAASVAQLMYLGFRTEGLRRVAETHKAIPKKRKETMHAKHGVTDEALTDFLTKKNYTAAETPVATALEAVLAEFADRNKCNSEPTMRRRLGKLGYRPARPYRKGPERNCTECGSAFHSRFKFNDTRCPTHR